MSYPINPDLLKWLDTNAGLCGYDGLTIVPIDRLNTALQDQHRGRLESNTVLTDIQGSFRVDDTFIEHYLAGYQMSKPALDMPSDTRFNVTCQLDSGMHVKVTETSNVLAVSQHDALNAMSLKCSLPLGPIVAQSLLSLDVAQGEDMMLGVDESEQSRKQGGELIQGIMQANEALNEPYVLVSMGADADSALAMKQVDIQVQKNAQDERSDLLLWAATQQGKVGQIPANASVPGIDPTVTTVVNSARLMHRVSYGRGLAKLLEGGAFAERRDSENMVVGLDATAGHLVVPSGKYQSADYTFECDTFTVPADKGLTVTFEREAAEQTWTSSCTVDFRYKPYLGGEQKALKATFQLNLAHRFNLLEAPSHQARILQGQLYSRWRNDEVRAGDGLPEMPDAEREQIEEFIGQIIKRAIVSGLSKELRSNAPESWLEGLQVGEDMGVHLQASAVTQGHDVAMITTPTEYVIEPRGAVVLAGEACDLQLVPARGNVNWHVISLPVSADDPGYMDTSTGPVSTYQAASLAALGGKPSKVLVVARDIASNQLLASTLVTTVTRAVTVNPMIQSCMAGETLTFTAGSLRGGDLAWAIENAVEGKSGSLDPQADGKRCVYTASEAVIGDHFIDSILVEDPRTHETCKVHVLVRPKSNALGQVVLKTPPVEGQAIELAFIVSGNELPDVQWSLPLEPDKTIVDGRYSRGDEAGVVLVVAEATFSGIRFYNHLILPWPLTDFPELCQKLLTQPS
ncbi:hypothetical protein [Pseudomonas guariconensis]|uniref:hypothetical protein n=1 Tax=Pseudomonas guariconensis TaxID=1288410 RepID=UPI0018AC3960|nr:hypothetical protein [Pseudomonas guariconensis]MBF8722154.1 hypothetical protein [Pseudomonas guariconensis]